MSISALGNNFIGVTPVNSQIENKVKIVSSGNDLYDEMVERKEKSKDWYAKIISKITKNNKRPDSSVIATVIGGFTGALQAGIFAFLHYKVFRKNSTLLDVLKPS